MKRATFRRMVVLAAASSGLATGQNVVYFTGLDAGAGPGDPLPNAGAAATSFEASAVTLGDGTLNQLDFETVNLGDFLNLTPAETGVAGLSILPAAQSSGADTSITDQVILVEEGFNTTPGGSRFLKIEENQPGVEPPVGVTFDFATPVVAFGGYFTSADPGVAGAITALFDNGQVHSVSVDGSPGGGAQFWGFTDDGTGGGVSRVTILASPELSSNKDAIGLDDIVWVNIPEPSSALLVLTSGLVLGWRRRR